MPLFKSKLKARKGSGVTDAGPSVELDITTLRQNNITRLTIDERWMKLFITIPMSSEIEKAQNEMNELIKKEAMLRSEQDDLEPTKRMCMNKIMGLTQEAFEHNSNEAKEKLKDCKKEIERINGRTNKIMEEVEKISDELKSANVRLLHDTLTYIFGTLKNNKNRSHAIMEELSDLEKRGNELKAELDSINLDWTSYAVNFTELIGSDLVNKLENEFGLGELKYETDNSGADEKN